MDINKREEENNSKLLRMIVEQNREKILEYDVASDEAFVYKIVDGQFVMLYQIPGYLNNKRAGEVFITPEDRKKYR